MPENRQPCPFHCPSRHFSLHRGWHCLALGKHLETTSRLALCIALPECPLDIDHISYSLNQAPPPDTAPSLNDVISQGQMTKGPQ